ncbi:MAG: SDR family oxidoreductase [Aquabacterium sp.]
MTAPKPPLVFITGASSGIGQALAQRYARDGARLALVARRRDAMSDWVRTTGLDATRVGIYGADVRDTAAVTAAGRDCIAAQGLPDIVVANAGISVGMDSEDEADLAVMRDTLLTNVLGMAATFQPFLSGMRARGHGALVGVASVAGIRGLPGHGAYCASKSAAIAYCESLRGECRGSGVRVVTLVPGYVDTPLTRGNRYAMPFRVSASDFADAAQAAIAAGTSYRVIPWQMGVVAKLLRLLPNVLFDRMLAGRPRKARRP